MELPISVAAGARFRECSANELSKILFSNKSNGPKQLHVQACIPCHQENSNLNSDEEKSIFTQTKSQKQFLMQGHMLQNDWLCTCNYGNKKGPRVL